MGLSDTPPPHVPPWVVPLSGALLIIGAIFWDISYILMTLRSHRTHSYSMPVLALAENVSWEIVYSIYVSELTIERLGFLAWLFLDIGVVYTTIRSARYEWEHAPIVARNFGLLFAVMLAVGCVGNYAFAAWWLSVPGMGHGDKTGKWWFGVEGIDCTELAFWSAGVSSLTISPGCLAMLLVRGHSGGASYGIWVFRTMGTLLGWIGSSAVLWHYWPEAHGYFVNPFGIFLMVTCTICDLIYPFVLAQVQSSERVLPDGRVVAAYYAENQIQKKSM